MRIVMEKAAPMDAQALLAYLKQVGRETENLTFGAEGLPLSIEEERAYLQRLEHSRDGIQLLVKADGRIIADASLTRLPRRMGHRGELGIAVLKEYWNQGIGSQLLGELLRFAKENGFEILDLQVRSDNAAAIHLYEKFGFQRLGTHNSFFKIGAQEIPFDLMCARIASGG